jgi:hypothetical protein
MPLFDTGSSGGLFNNITSKIGSILDPSSARLSAANLLKGGDKAFGAPGSYQQQLRAGTNNVRVNLSPMANNEDATGQAGTNGEVTGGSEWRVRITTAPNVLYNDPENAGIMEPLNMSGGVIFPYTPTVNITYQASYSSQKLTHSNQPAYFYDSSEVAAISIAGDFSVQTDSDARYLLAVISFFRATTKMYFGESPSAGNPPPIVFLDGYGPNILDHISCVVMNFQQVLPAEVDYYYLEDADCRIPTMSQLQVTLQPVMSRAKLAKFNLNDFAAGKMLGGGYF